MNESAYYNARPSKVSNLGKDVSGAKRMYFDTYETDEEKRKRKAHNKEVKQLKKSFKLEVLSDCPKSEKLISLQMRLFYLEHGFHYDHAKDELANRRKKAIVDRSLVSAYNSLVRKYNLVRKTIRGLEYSPEYTLRKLNKKYAPKNSFTEQTGKRVNWKDFEAVNHIDESAAYLKEHSQAVQFGNSVTDNERAYILKNLAKFIKHWNRDSIFGKASLKAVSWSFGARGKAGSVAYYQNAGKIISVNRNNVGSLIHEIGHFLDYQNNLLSDQISAETIRAYRDSIKDLPFVDAKSLRYYCSRKEIFARAFEAYCYKVKAGFDEFAQCGKSFLPELNDELLDLVSSVFRAC